MADLNHEWYGLELMAVTNLRSGTLYPLLHRLVDDGWLERTREMPSDEGGTSRRLYKLTGQGATGAAAALAQRRTRTVPVTRLPILRPGVLSQ